MSAYDAETVRRAVEIVTEWRGWDHQMQIPNTQWGNDLAFGIDVLIAAAQAPMDIPTTEGDSK